MFEAAAGYFIVNARKDSNFILMIKFVELLNEIIIYAYTHGFIIL